MGTEHDRSFHLSRRALLAATPLAGVAAAGAPILSRVAMAQDAATPEPAATPARQSPSTSTKLGPVIPDELTGAATNWPTAQGNLKATRAAQESPISRDTVSQLGIAWRYPLDAGGQWGAITSSPIIVDDRIYLQDAACNVHAISKSSGERIWRTDFKEVIGGPNGIGIGYGILVVSLGDSGDIAGLDAETGELLWRTPLTANPYEPIEIAPVIYDSTAYVSTNPTGSGEGQYRGGEKGIFYAVDVSTGNVLWQWDTTSDNLWGMARINSGGGVWYPVSIDDDGNLYFGTGNAAPWPGTEEFPNGSSRPPEDLYASCMVSLNSETGELRWYLQAKPHDLFDLDFQNTPVLATVTVNGTDTLVAIGSGKAGTVIAADAETGTEVWRAAVGMHQNDELQEIPEGETVEVYPGSLGGVETPIAYSDNRVFVPILNMPGYYTATGSGEGPNGGLNQSTGQFTALDAATGEVVWDKETPTGLFAGATIANDIVFTGGLDGVVRGYGATDGELVWTAQTGSGLNAPFSISGDYLIVPSGGPLIPSTDTSNPAPAAATEVIAFKLGAEPIASPAATLE
jgi:glucose dehydrogenase